MKKDKSVTPKTTEKVSGKGSNPENKFKKDESGAAAASITSALNQTKAKSGRGTSNEGTNVSYEGER